MSKVRVFQVPAYCVKGWEIYGDGKTLIHININFMGKDYIVEMSDGDFIEVMVELFSKHPGLHKAITEALN
jgi:hypothetical protein